MTPDPILESLEQSLKFLDGRVGRKLAGQYALDASSGVLRKWRDSLLAPKAALSVVLVGEFNAGKSTLVNALLGREVAFTDPFEATAVMTAYHPGTEEFAKIVKDDGTTERWDFPSYFKAARGRALASVRRAEVSLRHDLPFILVDTPGLGSLSERHASIAEEAIIGSDVLVWVIDSNDILGAQEGAFLARCREIRMPIVVVLGKSDTLDPSEVEGVVQYLSDRLEYEPSDLIPIAAERHTRASPDAGVGRLLDRLHELARATAHTRARSRAAKIQEALGESSRAMEVLASRLREDTRMLKAEGALIEAQADQVHAHLLADFRARFFVAIREDLRRELVGNLEGNDLESLCNRISARLNEHSNHFQKELPSLVQEETRRKWKELFDRRALDLERQIELLTDKARPDQVTANFLREQLEQIQSRRSLVVEIIDTNFDSMIKLGIFFTGVALTLYTGGLQPLLMTSCLLLKNRGKLKVSKDETHYAVDDVLNVLSNKVGPEFIEQQRMSESISSYVMGIAGLALEALCRDRICDCTPDELGEAEIATQAIQKTIEHLQSIAVA